jgi:hydroxyethylthiazole kinase-like uncharacterized protein yjeF
MFAAGQKEMQQMDECTINTIGLPGIVLMENAGARVAEEIIQNALTPNSKVVVLAGSGNNGGDGFVIARRLFDAGIDTLLCLLANPQKIKGDAKVHYDVYINRGLPLFKLHENTIQGLKTKIDQADIIIDAILGTGVNGPVREPFYEVISLVNNRRREQWVVAVDIPSGVSSDTGNVAGTAIKADRTITFVFPKKGFFLQDGPQYIGAWKAVDISVPPEIALRLGLKMPKLITETLAQASIPIRPKHGHKGTFGHALIIGGSRNFVGAPIFSAKAALSSGAGLVSLALPETIYPMAAAQNPESLFLPLPEEDGHFSAKALDELTVQRLEQFDCIAIGPGMGRFPQGENWIKALIEKLQGQSLVIDADALYLQRNHLDGLRQYKGNVMMTPHPGEMANLLGKTVKEVEADRIGTAEYFAKKYHVFLLLKGHRSIIATPDGDIYINPYGHDALGKGGSGDVLTGMIASFLAQGTAPLSALIAASFLHARSGEEKAHSLSHYGVLPLDIIDGVKGLLLKMNNK